MEDIEKLVDSLNCMGVIEGRAANVIESLLAENERIRSNCYARDAVQAIIAERDELRAMYEAAVKDSIFRCCKTCRKNGRGYNGSCRYCKHCEFIPDGFKRGTRDFWEYCDPASGKGAAEKKSRPG